MTPAASKLARAREILRHFETEMRHSMSLVPLGEALQLLGEIRDDVACEEERQVACQLALTYMKLVQKETELALSDPSTSDEDLDHWKALFDEFECADFALPAAVAATLERLNAKRARRAIDAMSPYQIGQLIDLLKDSI